MKLNNPNELSSYIKTQRKTVKRTQENVADKIGLKQTTISSFEKSCATSKIETLFKIAHELGLVIEVSTKAERDNQKGWEEEW